MLALLLAELDLQLYVERGLAQLLAYLRDPSGQSQRCPWRRP